jgi:hypothetical protein
MTEEGKKKPGAEGAGQSDPLSATGMFLSAFRTEPEQPVDPAQDSATQLFAVEGKSGPTPGAERGLPFSPPPAHATPVDPSLGAPKPASPGEFTQMFRSLEPSPAPPPPTPASSTPSQSAFQNTARQEPGEFTRMFVTAASSPEVPPAPAAPNSTPFAPLSTPKIRGFSAPGVSDSASAEGSFTQLFRTPSSPPPAPPVQTFAPLPSAPPKAAEPVWPQTPDPVASRDATKPDGLSQLFRSLSAENEPPPAAAPPAAKPASVTMLMQKLTQDLQSPAASPPAPAAAAPAASSGPGEFTRIMAGGVANPPANAKPAMPVPAPPAFPAGVPAVQAPVFAPPPVPAVAVPQAPPVAVPPVQAPNVAASGPPPKTKLQQMLPMLLVLNAFLIVVLILLLVFALKSK